jgi:phage shock protein A
VIKEILCAVVLLIVIALALFPEFRRGLKVLASGFLGVFVKDLAKTPEGAEAVYNEAIEEERELYRKACDVLNKASGEYQAAQQNLAKLQEAKKKIEATCERLVREGRDNDAYIYAEKLGDVNNDIERAKKVITEYEAYVEEAKKAVNFREKRLKDLKKKQKDTINDMKLAKQTKALHEDMDELRRDRTTHKLLDAVNEGASDLRKEADGARIVHQSKNSTKVANIEKDMESAQASDYIASLKEKYKKG